MAFSLFYVFLSIFSVLLSLSDTEFVAFTKALSSS